MELSMIELHLIEDALRNYIIPERVAVPYPRSTGYIFGVVEKIRNERLLVQKMYYDLKNKERSSKKEE